MIKDQLHKIQDGLPRGVMLVAVSKYHSVDSIQAAYDAGQRVFGESHVQELVQKVPQLPTDISWHFIGHLQTNKVKYITPFISLIHSVDSLKLLQEIDKQAEKCERVVDVLLQIHVAEEETKFGFQKDDLIYTLSIIHGRENKHYRIVGLMCMATNTMDENQIHEEFRYAKSIFDEVKEEFFADDDSFSQLSMGMSDDYMIAVDEGSTMVRIGSKIFGERQYD